MEDHNSLLEALDYINVIQVPTSGYYEGINLFWRSSEIKIESSHLDLENILANDYNEILKREKDFWKIKSRIQWINNEDVNTKFFYISTTNRRRRNRIIGINNSVGYSILILLKRLSSTTTKKIILLILNKAPSPFQHLANKLSPTRTKIG